MAYLTYNFSAELKEEQKSPQLVGQLLISGTDSTIQNFDAGKQISIPKGATKVFDLSSYTSVSFIGLKVLSGKSVRLRLKKAERNSTDLVVLTSFHATVEEIEKVELVAPEDTDVKVLLMVAGQ
jgi:hypothetical protein